jgi:hypothetical protein
MKYKLFALVIASVISYSGNAQALNDEFQRRMIDKTFEIGVPALVIMVILYTLTQVVKIQAEKKIRERMIEKGISEETIILLTRNANKRLRLEFLKWGFILGYTSVAFLVSQYIVFGFVTFALVFAALAAAMFSVYFMNKRES